MSNFPAINMTKNARMNSIKNIPVWGWFMLAFFMSPVWLALYALFLWLMGW